jgi:hypothetical protein
VLVVLWRIGAPSRLLTYETPLVASLFNTDIEGLRPPALEMSYHGASLADPHIVILEVQSRSRKDIRSTDFDDGKPLVFDLGAEIVSAGGPSLIGPRSKAIKIAASRVELSPILIRRGYVLELSLIVDGAPHLMCQSNLADVKVQRQTAGNPQVRIGLDSRSIKLAVGTWACWLVASVALLLSHGIRWQILFVVGFPTAFIAVIPVGYRIRPWR